MSAVLSSLICIVADFAMGLSPVLVNSVAAAEDTSSLTEVKRGVNCVLAP